MDVFPLLAFGKEFPLGNTGDRNFRTEKHYQSVRQGANRPYV
jgi:hypothetical protein